MERKDLLTILSNVGFILLGLFLLIFSEHGLPFLFRVFSLAILLYGVFLILQNAVFAKYNVSKFWLVSGVILAVLGLVLFIFANSFANTLLPALLGIGILVMGIMRIVMVVRFVQFKFPLWWLPLIFACVAVVLALLILTHTLETSMLLSIIIGIFLLFMGIFGLGEYYTLKKLRKDDFFDIKF